MAHNNTFVVGIYDDEDEMLAAVGKVREKGINIHEVYTPFPIHGLDRAIGHPRTRIPVAAFCFGATGLTLGILFTFWTMGIDWPMNIGGKNFFPFPTNVPVLFELTVLFASFGMVFTFFISNSLWWGNKANTFDLRSTDDKFVVAVDVSANHHQSETTIEQALKDSGAIETSVKTLD